MEFLDSIFHLANTHMFTLAHHGFVLSAMFLDFLSQRTMTLHGSFHCHGIKRLGFSLTGAWKFYDYDYSIDINSSLPKGCKFFDGEIDLIKLKKCIWQGFDNDGDNEDISVLEKIIHHKKYSHMDVIVINEDNEYVGYCGVWIEERNKLCYLEPLCVISSYRNKGVGKAIIAEVIRKTKDLGLRRMTGGISDFYKQIGFSSNFRQEIYER